jgi:hypothetical protein
MSDIAIAPLKDVVTKQRWLMAIVASSAILVVGADSCRAQCVERSERVAPIALETFSAQPASLLQELRSQKQNLTGRLEGILVTDPTLLSAIPRLLGDSTSSDRPAIGAALRRAELRCLASKPQVARKISDFVRKLGDSQVLSGYAAVDDVSADLLGSAGKPVGAGAGLMTGEWKTELADPFAAPPLPQ